MKLRAQRLDVIAGNIANAATPGFKARDLDADGALMRLQAARSSGFGAVMADQLSGDIKYRAALVPSLDGNTVEMATEQAVFAENAVKYRASLGFLTSRIQTIMSALKGGE
ncbi:flagellar basal body rod protein FlgB [Sandarakinorhabdus limnophila]|uniref:flagellar basal body rod protein FlgB n=1 Tax=Sandarakinorhabdus limnophila TaxID=210512 RepID=UPI0026EBFD1B|nr:flagellar basal body rod protein FlgB [Sandarakinorhabdus limnophila]MCM0033960.1 flagellar basal body rod protein FlgB [Sandarakinorhabdus limnophila]